MRSRRMAWRSYPRNETSETPVDTFAARFAAVNTTNICRRSKQHQSRRGSVPHRLALPLRRHEGRQMEKLTAFKTPRRINPDSPPIHLYDRRPLAKTRRIKIRGDIIRLRRRITTPDPSQAPPRKRNEPAIQTMHAAFAPVSIFKEIGTRIPRW